MGGGGMVFGMLETHLYSNMVVQRTHTIHMFCSASPPSSYLDALRPRARARSVTPV